MYMKHEVEIAINVPLTSSTGMIKGDFEDELRVQVLNEETDLEAQLMALLKPGLLRA